MKKKWNVLLAGLVLLFAVSSPVFASEQQVGSGAAAADTSYTLEEMLRYALEDERMAQAEYEGIMKTFDVKRPFENIAKAEEKHEEAILRLYQAKGIPVPDFDPQSYVVIPNTMAEIYRIGVEAEIKNIAMYEKFLGQDLDEDVRAVFQALKKGSENHLKAFERGDRNGSMTGQQNNGKPNNGNQNNRQGAGNQGTNKQSGLGNGLNRQNNPACIFNNQ